MLATARITCALLAGLGAALGTFAACAFIDTGSVVATVAAVSMGVVALVNMLDD